MEDTQTSAPIKIKLMNEGVYDQVGLVLTRQAWTRRYSITNTCCRLRDAPNCSCLKVIFRDVGDILDSVWRTRHREVKTE